MKKEFRIIADLIEKNSRILDVGCGDGELMSFILNNISRDVRGIEISKINVQKCISKGLTVIEGDAEKDLFQFPDSSFDFVILSQTLQAFLKPEKVLEKPCSNPPTPKPEEPLTQEEFDILRKKGILLTEAELEALSE